MPIIITHQKNREAAAGDGRSIERHRTGAQSSNHARREAAIKSMLNGMSETAGARLVKRLQSHPRV